MTSPCTRTLLAAAILYAGSSVAVLAADADDFYGTTEPFASEAIYFVMTDRFVNGDPSNDHRDQGGKDPALRTFDRPVPDANGDNIGYLGGDFKGIVDNAGYIRGMGFTSVWVTPIVDNPDQAFTGGSPIGSDAFFKDQGKTGYHGYWATNFYKLDEHLPSEGLDFAGFTQAMKDKQLDVVLDIVGNHGSPAYSMPKMQPQYGKVYDRDGKLVADHQNLDPARLDPAHKRLHAFYNTSGGLAQLSDFDQDNPAVLDYLVGAYEQWIDQGAAAFRVDTIGWMPHRFWKAFADRIRARHPGFFMFGEAFNYDAATIAGHTLPRNGGISVLDFPLRGKLMRSIREAGQRFRRTGEGAVPGGRPLRQSLRPGDLLRQPRHGPDERHATRASSTPTTGCSPRAASPRSITVRKPASCAAAPNTMATATTTARSAWMRRARARSIRR